MQIPCYQGIGSQDRQQLWPASPDSSTRIYEDPLENCHVMNDFHCATTRHCWLVEACATLGVELSRKGPRSLTDMHQPLQPLNSPLQGSAPPLQTCLSF